jgi:hypothetical protein
MDSPKTPLSSMDLSKTCLLVNLTIRTWQANKQDTGIAQEVAQAKGVEDTNMGRYWKSLLPKCDEVDLVYQAAGKARRFHYENTLPYMHDGPRILPTQHYEPYMAAMAELREEFDGAVLSLVAKYDQLKLDAKRLMGSLFNELDYPEKNYVRDRYGIEITPMPMPTSNTLLELNFDASAALAMKNQLEAALADRFRRNARALWDQLQENVDALLQRLSDPKKSITTKSLDASRRLASLLPKLNVVEDKRLDAVCQHLADTLNGVTHSVLASDADRRDKVCAGLRSIRSAIGGSKSASTPSVDVATVEEEPVTLARVA